MLKQWILCFVLLLNAQLLWAEMEPLQPGTLLPEISMQDQFDAEITVADDVEFVLFTASKTASGMVNAFLAKQEDGFLQKQKTYFLADISGMPSFVTKMFALPKMREFSYSVLLGIEEGELDFIPREDERITLLKIQKNKIVEIQFVASEEELGAVFSKVAQAVLMKVGVVSRVL
jgi:hypothetical protein